MTTIPDIIDATARHYGLTVHQLRGPKRDWRISHPRQLAMWIAHEHFNFTYAEIGRHLGGRDQKTVRHGVDAVIRRKDPNHRKAVEQITELAIGAVFRSRRNAPTFKSRRAA